jgi:hypothetical protein
VLFALGATASAFAGANPDFTLPLHASAVGQGPCSSYLPVDCRGVQPTVDVTPGTIAVTLLVFNHSQIAGVQTAFQPDPSWTFIYGLWDCQPGQVTAVTPAAPFGATAGSITTAFNCVYGPALTPVGRMIFSATSGCLTQVQSNYPFGTHVLDCANAVDQARPGEEFRLGKICVGQGGYAACTGGGQLQTPPGAASRTSTSSHREQQRL